VTANDLELLALEHPRGSRVSTAELLDEVDEYFWLGASVMAGATVVDVGANVGAFALRIAECCRGDVRLLCFEPSPETHRALRVNLATNRLLRQTRHSLYAVGLSSAASSGEELTFYNFRRFPTNSSFDLAGKRREFEIFFEDRGHRIRNVVEGALPGALGRCIGVPLEWMVSLLPKGALGWWASKQIMGLEEVKVRVETLDAVVRRERIERIDLLKIDVEGHELEVLRGLGPASWPAVQQVVLETHNRDGRQLAIEALLRTNGLTTITTTIQKTVDNGLESVMLLATRS
jgi:FkbM family methyltransferase